MNDQPSCLGTVRVRTYGYRECQWAHLHGFNSVALLRGVHPIIIYTSTGDDSCARDVIPDVPLLNLLPFLAKRNHPVHGSVKCLFGTPPKGQQPLLVWILLALGLLGDVEHQETALMAIAMVAHACGHQSGLLMS